MKKIIILVALVLSAFVSSCINTNDPEPHLMIDELRILSQGRECTNIIGKALEYYRANENGKEVLKQRFVYNREVDTKNFSIWIMTGEDDILKFDKNLRYTEDIIISYHEGPELYMTNYDNGDWEGKSNKKRVSDRLIERELDIDFDKNYKIYGSKSHTRALPPFFWPYRTTGIKDFKITANTTLFGEKSGNTLNKYFIIDNLSPRQIISSKTKNLVFGYSSKYEISEIEQWISINPMAPPCITFAMKDKPSELPAKIEFTVSMTTNDGKVLENKISVSLK